MKFIDDSIGFVCGENGVALKTTDGGETWSAIATGTTANLMKIVFRDSRNGFIYASSQGLITSDGGTTWTFPSYTQPGLQTTTTAMLMAAKD